LALVSLVSIERYQTVLASQTLDGYPTFPLEIAASPHIPKPMEKPFKGLSSAEAQRILGQVGPNATPDVAVHPLRLVLGKFLAPVSVLLEIAIVLQLVLGEYVDGSIIGVLLLFNTAIGFLGRNRPLRR
jgi:H+-transporting ATPase